MLPVSYHNTDRRTVPTRTYRTTCLPTNLSSLAHSVVAHPDMISRNLIDIAQHPDRSSNSSTHCGQPTAIPPQLTIVTPNTTHFQFKLVEFQYIQYMSTQNVRPVCDPILSPFPSVRLEKHTDIFPLWRDQAYLLSRFAHCKLHTYIHHPLTQAKRKRKNRQHRSLQAVKHFCRCNRTPQFSQK